jgi:transposase InsO family protein
LLEARRIKHLTTQPYRPQTNGKVERFHRTMAREWPTGWPTDLIATETGPCHTGSSTTTRPGPTAHLGAGRRSAAFTTSVGRTTRSARLATSAHIQCRVVRPRKLRKPCRPLLAT